MANPPTPPVSRSIPAAARLPVQLLALAAGPAAWIAQLCADYGLSSYACRPGDTPRLDLPDPGEHGLLLAVNLACLALAIAGFGVSLSAHRNPQAGAPGRRIRFLATCGLLASTTFAAAIVFNTPSAVAVRLCWSAPR